MKHIEEFCSISSGYFRGSANGVCSVLYPDQYSIEIKKIPTFSNKEDLNMYCKNLIKQVNLDLLELDIFKKGTIDEHN